MDSTSGAHGHGYQEVGWEDVHVLDEIDVEVFENAISPAGMDFVNIIRIMRGDSRPKMIDVAVTIMNPRSDWWRRFAMFGELEAAAMMYRILLIVPYDDVEWVNVLSEMLKGAILHKAALMVIRIIVQMCPFAVLHSDSLGQFTAAHLAIKHQCDISVIRLLVCDMSGKKKKPTGHLVPTDEFPYPNGSISMLDADGLSLLHYAVLFRASLQTVGLLCTMKPNLIAYRTTNQQYIDVQVEDWGVFDDRGNHVFINGGMVYRCPGHSSALCIALQQNIDNTVYIDNYNIVGFLDEQNVHCKLVCDATGDIPFHKLIKGVYPDVVMDWLLPLFIESHKKSAQTAAVYTDNDGLMLLQLAIVHKMNLKHLDLICEFTMQGVTFLHTMIRTISSSDGQYHDNSSGIFLKRGKIVFDTISGQIVSVAKHPVLHEAPIFEVGCRFPKLFQTTNRIIINTDEILRHTAMIARWVTPETAARDCEETLQRLLTSLHMWFEVFLSNMPSNNKKQKTNKNSYRNKFDACVGKRRHESAALTAAQNAENLLAELEAEAILLQKKDLRPSRKARQAANRKANSTALMPRPAAVLDADDDEADAGAARGTVPPDHIEQQRQMEEFFEMRYQQEKLEQQVQHERDNGAQAASGSWQRRQNEQRQQREAELKAEHDRCLAQEKHKHRTTHAEGAGVVGNLAAIMQNISLIEKAENTSLFLPQDNEHEMAGARVVDRHILEDPQSHASMMSSAGWSMDTEWLDRFQAAIDVNKVNIPIEGDLDLDAHDDDCIFCLSNRVNVRLLPCLCEIYCMHCCENPDPKNNPISGKNPICGWPGCGTPITGYTYLG